ncbi:MAG: sigma-54-dependent Fis family transcriptional regulator [Planctomycetes bacterium]|nr:sigma-54-dependent Fis family transcriptional regulator [Planctomycetota bacterium]
MKKAPGPDDFEALSDSMRRISEAGGAGEALREVERLRVEIEGLRRLHEISKTLNSELKVETLLRRIMDAAIDFTRAERGFIILVEGQTLEFKIARQSGGESLDEPQFEVSRSVAVQVADSGAPYLADDASAEASSAGGSVQKLALRSVLCVPLRIRQGTVGVVYLDNRSRIGAFTESDRRWLEMFAEQAAIAVHNARLIEENLRQREELAVSKRTAEQLNELLQEKVEIQGIELVEVRRDLQERQKLLEVRNGYDRIVGRSPRMQQLYDLLDRVKDADIPVLVLGESGTGKELVARAIHFSGKRKGGRFVSENCAAIPDSLLESELFGHVKGAFTGAVEKQKGLFEQADKGTLFLDEVGNTSLDMQKKLLRVLETGEVRSVGGDRARRHEVRIITATNHALDDLVKAGTFREDLMYRLKGVVIQLPPLRQRREDIPHLVEHFFQDISDRTGEPRKRCDDDVMQVLVRHDWPGNVRELRTEVEKIAVLCHGELITRTDFEQVTGLDLRHPAVGGKSALVESVRETERAHLRRTLAACQGNRDTAAKVLGISRATLFRKMKKHRLK